MSKIVRDAISESLSGFPQKSQTSIEALWSLRSIDLRVIALHPSFVKLRMPQNASLVPLISEPIRVNVISFVIYKRGNSQYPEQKMLDKMERSRSIKYSHNKSLFEDFLWSWKNGLIHMQLPIDKRVHFSKTTPCHIKIFTGVLHKDVRKMAYQVGSSLFFALESYFRFSGHYSRTMLAK